MNSYSFIERNSERLLVDNDLLSAPVNVTALAKKLNIVLKSKDLDDNVSGVFFGKDDKKVIVINKSQGKKRKRFSIAHEIGHCVLHHENNPYFIDKVSFHFRNGVSSSGEDKMEREANHFGAALLMPRSLVDSEISNLRLVENSVNPIKELAKIFDVSEIAMAYRLANLGYQFGEEFFPSKK